MLRDHEPNDWTTDQFKLNEDSHGNPLFTGDFSFPCCCCAHCWNNPETEPCGYCGYNVNASLHNRPAQSEIEDFSKASKQVARLLGSSPHNVKGDARRDGL